ncbi:hypothetical protein [Antarcticirhabdus aurantiaca]|uniref:Uncharacterized protein n=1 Tax=Antarcticirhabdus aurantiaca TaxID=2606717 RepID=A0ACD4NKH1_9HYPH|nr:hypothetical protein [Antarcticirhabdus aurantiaca]WAJ27166.1 hypothetical protein OXU80_20250 [Jeongeuplla avenae]
MKHHRAYIALLLISLTGCEALEPSTLLLWKASSKARIVPAGGTPAPLLWNADLRVGAPLPISGATRRKDAYSRALTTGYSGGMSAAALPDLEIDTTGRPILPQGRPVPVINLVDIRSALRGGFDL